MGLSILAATIAAAASATVGIVLSGVCAVAKIEHGSEALSLSLSLSQSLSHVAPLRLLTICKKLGKSFIHVFLHQGAFPDPVILTSKVE